MLLCRDIQNPVVDAGVVTGLYSIPCGTGFLGAGYKSGRGKSRVDLHPRSARPNKRLHLTPLVGAEANGPEARCKGRDRYFKWFSGYSFRAFKRKSTFAAQVSRDR